MGYSVIIPTLNEAGHIVKLIEKIRSNFSEIQEKIGKIGKKRMNRAQRFC